MRKEGAWSGYRTVNRWQFTCHYLDLHLTARVPYFSEAVTLKFERNDMHIFTAHFESLTELNAFLGEFALPKLPMER